MSGLFFMFLFFCMYVCVLVYSMCKYALELLSQCTFLLKTQITLTTNVIKWSFKIIQSFILVNKKLKKK